MAADEPVFTERVFEGPLFAVDVERWPDPDRRRDVVRHPGAVAVLPFTADGRVVLVRQLREAVRRRLLEAPAGILDVRDEDAPIAAAREVREETGMAVRDVRELHAIYTSPGFVDETIRLFVAAVDEGVAAAPAEEGIEVVVLPREEAVAMARSGAIADAKTALLLLLTEERGGVG